MINQGDIAYFKTCTLEPTRKSPEIKFKGGNGFGILLGIVPPGQPEPLAETLLILLGQIGFISFDEIQEFLGEENLKICVTKFREKYYPKKLEEAKNEKIIEPNSDVVS